MASKTTTVDPAGLLSGANAFMEWRQSRHRGARIPDNLWAMAVSLAKGHGISKTSQVLRVGYYALKKRRDKSLTVSKPLKSGVGKRPQFVEISGSSFSSASTCSIVLEKEMGSKNQQRMKLEIDNASISDLAALVQQIWSSSR